MTRRFVLTFAALLLCLCMAGQKKQYKYVSAEELTIIGKVLPTSEPYTRIDTSVYKFDDKVAMKYAGYSTGLAVVFKTDSRNINAKWKTSGANGGANMTAILQKGLDLYIRKDGEWVFAGVGSPKMGKAPYDTHESLIVGNMTPGVKECLLYLPVFDKVERLEIGIDPDASIEAMENPFRFKIIFKGSSVTHGASASRPGMTYPARFGRDNGLYVCNMGFSGRSKLQKEFAHILADADADAFVFDTFSNPSGQVIRERFNEFVDIVRVSHPHTPLIFLQTERRETRNFNTRSEEIESVKQEAAEDVVRERMKTDKHIYFIDSEGFLGDDHIGTVDGSHPNDIGFSRMLDCITSPVLEILGTYGIDADNPQQQDSLAFSNAVWEVTELGKGAQSMYAQIPMFHSTQSISVVKYPSSRYRTEILHRPGDSSGKPSEIGSSSGAVFALNGGYFHVKERLPSVYFRKDGEQLGHTHPTELYRVDGVIGFKDRNGRKVLIESVSDTLLYDSVSRGWKSVMASGPF